MKLDLALCYAYTTKWRILRLGTEIWASTYGEKLGTYAQHITPKSDKLSSSSLGIHKFYMK
jgi:hypothetical protein